MKNLSKEDYRILKDRMYRAKNALELSLEMCPDLTQYSLTFKDGRQISLAEILSCLEKVREDIWEYGPPEVRMRHLKELVAQQPRGDSYPD